MALYIIEQNVVFVQLRGGRKGKKSRYGYWLLKHGLFLTHTVFIICNKSEVNSRQKSSQNYFPSNRIG